MSKKEKVILGLLLFSFLFLGYISVQGYTLSFDVFLYESIHLLPEAIFLPFFKILTVFGDPKFCVIILIVLLIVLKKQGIYCIGAALSSLLTNQLFKYVFARVRPDFEHLVEASGYSFPSGHTMISVILYGFLLYMSKKHIENKTVRNFFVYFLAILIAIIPLSRIYLGVHYATDIIGGYMIGTFVLYMYIKFYEKRNGEKE